MVVALRPSRRRAKRQATEIFRETDTSFHLLRPHGEKAGACLSQRDKLHQLTVVALVALRPSRRRAKRQATEIFRETDASFHFVAPARGKGGRLLVAARQAPPTHRGGFGRAATTPSPSEASGGGNLSRDGRVFSFRCARTEKGGRLLVPARQAPQLTVVALVALRPPVAGRSVRRRKSFAGRTRPFIRCACIEKGRLLVAA